MASTSTTAPGPTSPPKVSNGRAWAVTIIMFYFFVLNFADKVIVGLAGKQIMADLNITPGQFGIVQSSFYWMFAVGALVGGALIGRVNTRWLLAGTAALWVLSLAPLMFIAHYHVLLVSRVLLGFAEGPASAMLVYVVHTWFTGEKRATPTSIAMAGAAVGPIIAAPVLTLVIVHHSWHTAFGILTLAGLTWLPLWLLFGGAGPVHDDEEGQVAGTKVTFAHALSYFRRPGVIGLTGILLSLYITAAANITWLPLFLEVGAGYAQKQVGNLIALKYIFAAVIMILVAMLSQWMTKRGFSAFAARALLPAVLLIIGSLGTIAFSLTPAGALSMVLMVTLLPLAGAVLGVAWSGLSDYVPTDARGPVLGIVVAIYSLGGVAAPLVVGAFVGEDPGAAGYRAGFAGIGTIMLIGTLISTPFLFAQRRRDRRHAELVSPPAATRPPRRPRVGEFSGIAPTCRPKEPDD